MTNDVASACGGDEGVDRFGAGARCFHEKMAEAPNSGRSNERTLNSEATLMISIRGKWPLIAFDGSKFRIRGNTWSQGLWPEKEGKWMNGMNKAKTDRRKNVENQMRM
jgi:hypothetical protein